MVDKGVWEEAVRKDADEKSVGSCDRGKRGVCTTKRESIPVVKRRKRGSKRICEGAAEEGIHPAV